MGYRPQGPLLPNELWLYIFRLAATETSPPPSPLMSNQIYSNVLEDDDDTDDDDKDDGRYLHFELRGDCSVPLEPRIRAATRLTIVTVCRRWYNLGISILYECVVLSTRHAYESFIRAIDRKMDGDAALIDSSKGESLSIGDHIKRIHFVVHDADWLRKADWLWLRKADRLEDSPSDAIPITFSREHLPTLQVLSMSIRSRSVDVKRLYTAEPSASPQPESLLDVVRRKLQWEAPLAPTVAKYILRIFGATLKAIEFNPSSPEGMATSILPQIPSIQEVPLVMCDPYWKFKKPEGVGLYVGHKVDIGIRPVGLEATISILPGIPWLRFEYLRLPISSIVVSDRDYKSDVVGSGLVIKPYERRIWRRYIKKSKDRGVRLEFDSGELVELPKVEKWELNRPLGEFETLLPQLPDEF
jgi:hypothetical protein